MKSSSVSFSVHMFVDCQRANLCKIFETSKQCSGVLGRDSDLAKDVIASHQDTSYLANFFEKLIPRQTNSKVWLKILLSFKVQL